MSYIQEIIYQDSRVILDIQYGPMGMTTLRSAGPATQHPTGTRVLEVFPDHDGELTLADLEILCQTARHNNYPSNAPVLASSPGGEDFHPGGVRVRTP